MTSAAPGAQAADYCELWGKKATWKSNEQRSAASAALGAMPSDYCKLWVTDIQYCKARNIRVSNTQNGLSIEG
jgi:hypothetical protein